MICEYLQVTGIHESILDFADLVGVTPCGWMFRGFDTRWDEVLPSAKETPQKHILGSMYKMRIQGSEQLRIVLALYDRDILRGKDIPQNSS